MACGAAVNCSCFWCCCWWELFLNVLLFTSCPIVIFNVCCSLFWRIFGHLLSSSVIDCQLEHCQFCGLFYNTANIVGEFCQYSQLVGEFCQYCWLVLCQYCWSCCFSLYHRFSLFCLSTFLFEQQQATINQSVQATSK